MVMESVWLGTSRFACAIDPDFFTFPLAGHSCVMRVLSPKLYIAFLPLKDLVPEGILLGNYSRKKDSAKLLEIMKKSPTFQVTKDEWIYVPFGYVPVGTAMPDDAESFCQYIVVRLFDLQKAKKAEQNIRDEVSHATKVSILTNNRMQPWKDLGETMNKYCDEITCPAGSA